MRKESNRVRGTYSLETAEGGTLSGHRKKATGQGTLTLWRPQKERLVRTWKETDWARGTHFLEATEGGTHQDTERDRSCKGTHFL